MKKHDMDYTELRKKIKLMYKTEENFAKYLGLSKSALCLKLNNKTQFSQTDIIKSCELLQLEKKFINDYFFTLKVEKNETVS